MKTPQKRTKNESIGDEQQNILCAFLINIISCHILFIVLPTRFCDFSVRVDIWRDQCDRRSRKIFCELRKFLGKQREMLYSPTPNALLHNQQKGI